MTINKAFPNEKPVVVFVPGAIQPADLAFAPLLNVIGDQIRPVLKDLEVYASDTPPAAYGVDLEAEGIRGAADAVGAQRFHLVGYSGGGAFALVFAAKYPERLRSLTLIEPAWIGAPTGQDAEDWIKLGRLMILPPEERMPAFMAWHFRPGAQPPSVPQPPGPPPPWMAKRPAGLEAIFKAYHNSDLDRSRFPNFNRPVYYALGSLSNRFFEREAFTLSSLFPDMQVEEYQGRSHFDPPHRAEPERFASVLRSLWARREAAIAA